MVSIPAGIKEVLQYALLKLTYTNKKFLVVIEIW